MKNTIITFGLFAALFSTACGDAAIENYDADYDAVRFTAGMGTFSDQEAAFDTETDFSYFSYSFLDTPFVKDYEFDIPVYLVGKPAPEDRTFAWEILPEQTTAPKGSYEVVASVIPANAIRGYLRVRIDNADELNDMSYTVGFRLVANEQLKVGQARYLRTQLTWHNSIPYPPHNNLRRTYNMLIAGEANYIATSAAQISPNGLKAIVAATGWDDWDDSSKHQIYNNEAIYQSYKYLPRYNALVTGDLYKAYALMLQDYLDAYKAEYGKELLHNAGAQAGQPIKARTY